MKRTTIDLDSDFIEQVKARMNRVDRIMAFDIGSSTGWAVMDRSSGKLVSGQCKPNQLRDTLAAHGLKSNTIQIWAREKPYTMSREQISREGSKMTPKTMYSMGVSAGYITAKAEEFIVPDAPLWEPMPSSWRAALGLNRTKTIHASARDETNRAIHLWASATSRKPLMNGNSPCLDEANAIGIAFALRCVINSIVAF